MRSILLTISVVLLLGSCISDDINDQTKRNENWAWFVDEETGTGRWIPVSEGMDVSAGEYSLFYTTGELAETGIIRDSVHADTVRKYDKSGKCIRYTIYRANQKTESYYTTDGPYKELYTSGKLLAEGVVKDHKEKGTWNEYYKTGKLYYKLALVNDSGAGSYYYESGRIKDSVCIVNGKQNGVSKFWYENGNLRQYTNWKNNLQDGEQRYYFENGQLQAKEFWTNGMIQGNRLHYYENGKLRSDANFLDNQPHGPQKKYHENGQLQCQGLSEKGKQTGLWLWYDETGKLYQKDTYVNGELKNVEKVQ